MVHRILDMLLAMYIQVDIDAKVPSMLLLNRGIDLQDGLALTMDPGSFLLLD